MKILLATDGAAPSDQATELLVRLADPARSDIQVVSVNSFESAFAEAKVARHYSAQAGREHAERAVGAASGRLREAGLRADGAVRDGEEAGEILQGADEFGGDLIVVGTGKERWVDMVALGSVSSSVLHAATCPVLVVHTAPRGEGTPRALVGTDGSDGSRRAIAAFTDLADPARCDMTIVAAANDRDTSDAQRAAADAERTSIDAGFRTDTIVRHGSPVRVLLEESERIQADLVVVGARGLGRFRAKVLGSVSDRMVRHAAATLVGR